MSDETKKQNWNSELSKELRERRDLLKEAQRLYYQGRQDGLSHPVAFAVVIEELISFLKKAS